MAKAETATLRYRLHVAAKLGRGGGRRHLKISTTWPWATQLATAFTNALA